MGKKKSDWQNRIVGHDTKPASWFLANEANWRIHPKNQQDSLGGVLDEVGWVQDVIVNKRTSEEWGADQNIETLVDGHLRITLALRNGDETPVPVKFVDLSPDEESLILLSLDPIGAMAATDKSKLDELMGSIQSDNERVQAMMKEMAEKEGLEFDKAEPPEDVAPQIDKAEELRKKWGVETGQLWALGNHRIICGDCTDKAVVDKLMGGEKVSLVVTDPPYGVDYEGIINDSPETLVSLLEGSMTLADERMENGAVFYICHPDIHSYEFTGVVRRLGWKQGRPPVVLWLKDVPVMGRGDYNSQFEQMLYGWKGSGHYFAGDIYTNVWEFPRPKKAEAHPTEKPIGLFENAIKNSSRINAIIYEPFSGSGTTIIACERLNRKCRAIEISPAYVAVAIQRWVDVTGGEPELISTE